MDIGNMIVELNELKETYTNCAFHCQRLALGSTLRQPFVDCTFPSLLALTLKDPQPDMFVRCTFPKLRIVTGPLKESTFISCAFSSQMYEMLALESYVNCYIGNHYHDDYGYLYDKTDEYEWHAIEIIEESPEIILTVRDSYLNDLT